MEPMKRRDPIDTKLTTYHHYLAGQSINQLSSTCLYLKKDEKREYINGYVQTHNFN